MSTGASHNGGAPLVSVVIPTTGRPEVVRAVRSVVTQEVRAEVVVVVDRPAALAEVEAALAPMDCTIVVTAGTIGSSAARNLGIDHATGAYIGFCDDDDWWAPGKLRRQLEAIHASARPERAVATCAMVFHRGDGSEAILPRRLPEPGEGIGDYVVSRPRVRFGDGVMQTSCLIVAADVMHAARWDESLRLHEDWDLTIRLLEEHGGELVWVTEPLAHVQQGSVSSLSAAGDWRDSRTWLELHGGRLSPTALGDFLAVHIMRPALARRDRRGVAYALRGLARCSPHPASLLVAGLGLVGR